MSAMMARTEPSGRPSACPALARFSWEKLNVSKPITISRTTTPKITTSGSLSSGPMFLLWNIHIARTTKTAINPPPPNGQEGQSRMGIPSLPPPHVRFVGHDVLPTLRFQLGRRWIRNTIGGNFKETQYEKTPLFEESA